MKDLIIFILILMVGILIGYFSNKTFLWTIQKNSVVADTNFSNQEKLTKRYIFLKSLPTMVNSTLTEEYQDLSMFISGQCNQKNPINAQLCKDYISKKISTNVKYSDTEKLLLSALIANDRTLCKGNLEVQDIFDRINHMKNPSQVPFPKNLNDNDNEFYLYLKIHGPIKYMQELDQFYKTNTLNHE